MSLTILTPLAALVAVAVVLPVVALRRGERRAEAVARSLGLPGARRSRAAVAAVAVLAALLALAASQPVLAVAGGDPVRADAEVFVVLDTTRSMLATRGPGSPTRFARAGDVALRLRGQLADVEVGLASFTDRVLPHLFPSTDRDLYAATLERVVRVEQPPPERAWDDRATTFGALSALATRNFFAPEATRRVVVLLTDGETQAYSLPALAAALERRPGIVPIVVHVRRDGERLFVDGTLDRGYESDPDSRSGLEELASATGGAVVSEDDVPGLARAVRDALGDGERRREDRRRRTIHLAPWLALGGVVPLALLIGRRNL